MKLLSHLTAGIAAALISLPAGAAGEAKNVIFFLGDGMGPTTITAARIYKYGEAGRLNMETLPRTARIRTNSLDAQTTDSAPSMSAYMTGVKMKNEVLAMSGDTNAYDAGNSPYVKGADSTCPPSNGTAVTTLLEMAKAKGKATGAVTTTRITHATPAATYSHICHRDGENDIAAQVSPGNAKFNSALGNGVDVLLGGGLRHFIPATLSGGRRTDGVDLTASMASAGYTVVKTGAALNSINIAATGKLLGLFNLDHVNYELDRIKQNIDEPSLATMTEKAIQILSKNASGYFLMVEGGRIDHALHGTDARRALEDTIAFDDAIKKALAMVDLSNTLIVVTADHDHTMTFNGYPSRGNPILGLTDNIKTKKLQMAADGKPFTTLVFGNGGGPRKSARDDLTTVDTASDTYRQEVAVPMGSLGSETHGGGDVMLFSGGAGSGIFKGTMDNTKVFSLVKTSAGL